MTAMEKDKLCRILFSELLVTGKTLTYKAEVGFVSFKTQMLSLGDGKDWLSELHDFSERIKSTRVLLDDFSERYK